MLQNRRNRRPYSTQRPVQFWNNKLEKERTKGNKIQRQEKVMIIHKTSQTIGNTKGLYLPIRDNGREILEPEITY